MFMIYFKVMVLQKSLFFIFEISLDLYKIDIISIDDCGFDLRGVISIAWYMNFR